MATASYAIGIGSNRRHGVHGAPAGVVAAALDALAAAGCRVVARSRVTRSRALGPAGRDFANAAAIVESKLDPLALLALLKRIERGFGRTAGLRWGPRVLDLDILLWSGGAVARRRLHVPHRAMAGRRFVLAPLAEIAPAWRLPGGGPAVRHLRARLDRRAPVDRSRPPP